MSADAEYMEPCWKCGRTDLPLHSNYQCPECYTPDPDEERVSALTDLLNALYGQTPGRGA